MDKNGRKNSKDPRFEHLDLRTADVVSTNDLTGLIPANPQPDDIDEYNELKGFGNDMQAEKPLKK